MSKVEPTFKECPKCGEFFLREALSTIRDYYVSYEGPAKTERLRFTCRRCSYSWTQPCADAKGNL